MRTNVKIIHGMTLGSVESQINEFLNDFATFGRILIDIKMSYAGADKVIALIIFNEEE